MKLRSLAALILACGASSCVTHTHATDYSGVPGLRGEPVEYQSTTSWSLNGLFVFPLLGNSGLDSTVGEFTKEASGRGATRVHLTQNESFTYWFIFPPISFFIHPVKRTVEGTVEGTAASEG